MPVTSRTGVLAISVASRHRLGTAGPDGLAKTYVPLYRVRADALHLQGLITHLFTDMMMGASKGQALDGVRPRTPFPSLDKTGIGFAV